VWVTSGKCRKGRKNIRRSIENFQPEIVVVVVSGRVSRARRLSASLKGKEKRVRFIKPT